MSFNFANPWWFLALPFIAVSLFVIYKNRGVSIQKKVSSITLLNEFKKTPNTTAIPFLPVRLILEFIFLSVVIFALSRFVISSKSEKLLIIADLSFSTLARDSDGGKLSEKLKKQIFEFVNRFDSTQTFSLQIADGSPINDYLNSEQLIDKINSLSNNYVDNLDQILNQASLNTYDQVFIATDRDIDKSKIPSNFIVSEVRTQSKNNLYFSDVRVQKNANKTFLIGNIIKSVRYDANKLPFNVLLKLESNLLKSPESYSIQINQESENKFSIPLSVKSYKSLQIDTDSYQVDSIQQDSYLDIENLFKNAQDKVVVQEVDPVKLNLPNISGIPEFVSSDKIDPSSKIFGNIIFAQLTDEVINKFSGNLFVQYYDPKLAKVSIPTEWNSESSLLTYITFDKERKFSYTSINCPLWMTSDLKIDGSTVLCSGIFEGKRVTYSGTPLLPIDIGTASVSNIIALNAIKWTFLSQNETKQVLDVESSFANDKIENLPIKYSPSIPVEDLNQSQVPFKWFTIILSIIIFLDTIWWVRKSRVFGR